MCNQACPGRITLYCGAVAVFLLAGSGLFAGQPQDQLKKTLDAVLDAVKDPALQGAENEQNRLDRVTALLAERFDFQELGMRTLGRTWNGLSAAERDEFVSLFRKLLENTYLTNIDQLTNDNVIFDKEIKLSDDKYTIVTRAITTDKKEIPVEYNVKSDAGNWLIYDVKIEGVSLVKNYRTQFSRTLQRKSFQELLTQLREKISELK